MERNRFDTLTRLLVTPLGSRRALLGALLGASLMGRASDLLAKPGKQRKRRKKRGHEGTQTSAPEPQSCCGTKRCDPPQAGSTRAGCDFGGRSFARQNLNGSVFRGIDGRLSNFFASDNRGSVFTDACLFAATFRGAKLSGTVWDGACLLAADFTGADFGGDATALERATLCFTVMPDGSRNDRDCNNLPPCCQDGLGRAWPCNTAADCPDEKCQTAVCDFPCDGCLGVCLYDVFDGPSPNGLCDTVCCDGECCPSDAYVCDAEPQCCLPDSPAACDQSGACAATCGANCSVCVNLANGSVQCGDLAQLDCRSCASNADCPASASQCVASVTLRNTSVTLTAAQTCRNRVLNASCATIFPC